MVEGLKSPLGTFREAPGFNEWPGGKMVQPGKTATLEFCTVATRKDNEIAEERLFYDVVVMAKQLGLWEHRNGE